MLNSHTHTRISLSLSLSIYVCVCLSLYIYIYIHRHTHTLNQSACTINEHRCWEHGVLPWVPSTWRAAPSAAGPHSPSHQGRTTSLWTQGKKQTEVRTGWPHWTQGKRQQQVRTGHPHSKHNAKDNKQRSGQDNLTEHKARNRSGQDDLILKTRQEISRFQDRMTSLNTRQKDNRSGQDDLILKTLGKKQQIRTG